MELEDRKIFFDGEEIRFETWTELDRSVHLTEEGLLSLYTTINQIMISHFKKHNNVPDEPKHLVVENIQPVKPPTYSTVPINPSFAPPPPVIKAISPQIAGWTHEQSDEIARIFKVLDIKEYKGLDAFIIKMNDPELKTYTDLNGSNADRFIQYMKKEGF